MFVLLLSGELQRRQRLGWWEKNNGAINNTLVHRNHHGALLCSAVHTRTCVHTHRQSNTKCEPRRTLSPKRKEEFHEELGKRLGGWVLVQYVVWKLDTWKICSKMKEKLSHFFFFQLARMILKHFSWPAIEWFVRISCLNLFSRRMLFQSRVKNAAQKMF